MVLYVIWPNATKQKGIDYVFSFKIIDNCKEIIIRDNTVKQSDSMMHVSTVLSTTSIDNMNITFL